MKCLMDFDDCWIRILDADMKTLRWGMVSSNPDGIPMGWMTIEQAGMKHAKLWVAFVSSKCTFRDISVTQFLELLMANIANMHFSVSENGSQIYLMYLSG